MTNFHSCTYLVVAEISSPDQIALEADLIALSKKYPMVRWQWGPREVHISPKVAYLAAERAKV